MNRISHLKVSNLLSLSLTLFVLFSLSSCLNDIDEVVTTEERPQPAVLENYDPVIRPVTASVVVFIVDENGDPVPGVALTVDDNNGVTDDYGHFFLNSASLNARGSLVQAAKPGYFDGSRRFFPLTGERSYVKIELIEKSFDHTFSGGSGGTVILPGGASIQFSGNSISKADGEVYTGEVRVAAAWLDPAQASTMDRMPGNLQGVDYFNREVVLSTFGMMAVELESTSGESLNIADEKEALLTMPVPAGLLGNAPATIPLWSYYEPLGIWVIEGEAALENGKYTGAVSHFSFWNCDAPFPLVEFQAQFVDTGGNPLVFHQVQIVTSPGYAGYGYTDEAGNVSGLIPANEPLVLNLANQCGEVFFSLEIGPFSEDTDLGQIVVPASTGVNSTVITGELLDCEGLPVTEGLVIAEFLGQTVYHYTDGAGFELTLTYCSGLNEVVVTGIDLSSFIQSDPLVVNPNTQTDLGSISVCDQQLQNYIILEADGLTAIYTPAEVRVDSTNNPAQDTTWTTISAIGSNTGGTEYYLFFGFEGPLVPGDYSSSNFVEIIQDFNNGWAFQGGMFDEFIVTEFTQDIIEGYFSGTLPNSNGNMTDVSGSFSVPW